MLKLVIADDEYIVVEGIKSIIDWAELGIELVGEAYDGLNALEIIKEKQPDIVMTDIRMPGINGLQLIERVKSFAPDTVFIVFSGFNEFEYAKKAVSLGVLDYIDKPVTIDKIEETLKRTKEVLGYRQEFNVMKEKVFETNKLVIEKLISDIISCEMEDYKKITEGFKSCGVDLSSIKEAIVGVGQFEANMDIKYEKVIKIIEEDCAEKGCESFFIKNSGEFVAVILSLSSSEADRYSFEKLQQYMKEDNENGVLLYMGLGKSYSSIVDLRKSYLEAIKALRYALFTEAEEIITIDEVEYNYTIPSTLNSSQDSIVYSIRLGDKEDVLKQVREFLNVLKEFNLKPDIFYHECLQLVYLGFKVVMETGKDFVIEQGGEFSPHSDILNFKTFDEISKWLINMFEKLMDWVLNIRNSSNHKSVITVKEYLERNFAKEITLNELAEYVNISPTYLSILFKEEVGTTYVKYLANLRMEKAKYFLSKGYKVNEVSDMVGYRNYRHFSNLFKKNFGMTPEQFKGKKILS